MGEVLPNGEIGGYEGYCPKCHKIIKTNMQGNEIGNHACNTQNKQPMILEKQDVYVVVSVKDELPGYSDDILVSYDNGITFPESAAYREHRKCMLAGIGGGNGYFGEGFCSNGSTGCDDGLILSDITHWQKHLKDVYILTETQLEILKQEYYGIGVKYGQENK